jgi:DNA-binding transcriptional MocR family regulator
MLSTSTLQTHINTVLQPAYSSRYHSTISSIQKHLIPLGMSLPNTTDSAPAVAGGYFIWLQLPEPLQSSEVSKRCMDEEDLMIASGPIFRINGDDGERAGEGNCFEGFLRVCFAWEDEGRLVEGIERLGRVVGRMVEEGRRGEGK